MNPAVAPSANPPADTNELLYVVLTGNPNCGKTTVFNALTGLRAKVGNYAGVTVERKEGRLLETPARSNLRILDLPGTYSLSPQSLDEQISRDVLLNRLAELPAPGVVVVVIDASNLQRNLYYATQVIELGYPTIIGLNMVDVAEANGHQIDYNGLSEALGVAVVPLVANTGSGIARLRDAIVQASDPDRRKGSGNEVRFCSLPPAFSAEVARLAELIARTSPNNKARAHAEALLLLSNEKALASSGNAYNTAIVEAVTSGRQRIETAGIDWRAAAIEARYANVSSIQSSVTTELASPGETFSDRLDRLLTHKFWGTCIFVSIMALIFLSIFIIAKWPMDWMEAGVNALGTLVGGLVPPGDLNSLLVNGVIAGVGAVVVFLPQILILFLFIGLLEDTGYMARAAFLMDRLMSRVGLHGKSFIPMLSSFACAIPGIMATRTIETPKDRLVTILVAPLMSCSARLPVYALLIGACIPGHAVFGIPKLLQGTTMLGMYLLGIVVALIMAWIFKKTLLRGETPMLIMELPPYKRPVFRVVMRHMWERSKIFLRRAGTVILGINIILWFLATYPRQASAPAQTTAERQTEIGGEIVRGSAPGEWIESNETPNVPEGHEDEAGESLRHSFAGRMGRLIEPAIAPLGFDWKIGIGIVTSFAAREVFVSTMSTVYNVADDGSGEQTELVETLREQRRTDGTPVYTTLTGVTLMVFYVFALQCVSTVAVVRRETNSWKWPLFQWLYMGILAWGFAFATFHMGRMLGLG